MRTVLRPMAARLQTRPAFVTVSPQPFVASLPTDLKIQAQLSECESAAQRQTDEAMFLFHDGYFVPGHSLEV